MKGFRAQTVDLETRIVLYEVYEPNNADPYEITSVLGMARESAREVDGTVVRVEYLRVKEID